MLPRVSASLGLVYARSGRSADGIRLLEESVDRATSMKLMNMYAIFLTWLGEAYLTTSRLEDAHEVGERAVAYARDHGKRGHEAHALALLGDHERALAIADELGMRPLAARCHLALGTVSLHAEDRASAERHLATAIGLFRAMDMRAGLQQAEEERKLLG
jgi:tetratricopeptide (TPR) repeat protein